ncbi:biotin carboxylase N-terminal domain-containing protein [Micromonospora sp. WMMD980]|uniref:acetyl/propionyl/methylcrotonyl-CoA carboxylase subunit alpha n=1 Tax=Micromonospora sp. WMMD980 TaxID=3016088 RepID=UPI002415A96E|nr:biotin carboxylase N-terminal domain-containing protein [Micromonospora sp. WMMD980]MDG4801386.1 biotin carboxylase N-terminal domain-containing protein [Micromonospora sp. WMMD980]
MHTVLIANRGEIAVRIVRACRDAGLRSVAVYADSDRDARHVRLADEAYALDGDTAPDSYLRIDKLLAVAATAGADAVHPGYGFLSENADFAQAVVGAGLTWIGPSPAAIRVLGDKVSARRIAEQVGAPLVPGTPEPARDATEIVAFAERFGLPVAIKAAFGGGGRGLKVARTVAEIPELFESATREAVAAFGRGECFAERYLDRPRHVEAQVLADQHGAVVVVGTRDCSLQRRHQKLVEEAPAPFLTDAQRHRIHSSAKEICRAAGYHGAGTVEYLVGTDGTISFLEVNTRLQVEHPVSEETSGIDLVREQFRIADGERLRFDADPPARGHAIEFRINGEDPGRGFLPAPGVVSAVTWPDGPGVRVDAGIGAGSVVGGNFDSLLAKVIVTGETRAEALARSRRVLDELAVDGLATVLPFHRAVVRDPAFTDEPFRVHTRWIETEWHQDVPPFEGGAVASPPPERPSLVVEIDGRRHEVTFPAGFAGLVAAPGSAAAGAAAPTVRPRRRAGGGRTPPAVVDGDALTSPMQGTVVKLAVTEGDTVAAGDLVAVIEAMKMEQPLHAHKTGVVTGLTVAIGQTLSAGTAVCLLV